MEEKTSSGLVEVNDQSGNNANQIGNNTNCSQKPELLEQEQQSELVAQVDNEEQTVMTARNENCPSTSEALDDKHGAKSSSKRSLQKGKRGSQELRGKWYSLRSSQENVRVLRSMSNSKNMAPSEAVKTPVQPAAKRRKRSRSTKRSPKNEFLTIRKRVRYLLNRMSYEQSLIDAYAGEGWKGQSLEKIRPEKELERAKAEILRCKLRIRDTFQNIDSLLSEGKLEESLFDSEGEISCEDIFCAQCGLKDVTLNNDIILCDGLCDRGFHQKCLNPPLLTEDIPPGDEGWLCPACDCKIDCIKVLNELQGNGLSIEDSWEKVFPEAAAVANGAKQYESDLPSDDSEDDDYDPNITEAHMEDQNEVLGSEESGSEESVSEESQFMTSSEDSDPSNQKKQYDELGLPSEDSEDDDFDPEGPNPDKDIQKGQSSSDESDFTSDSDDFCTELAKASGQDEVSTPSLSGVKKVDHTDETSMMDTKSDSADPSQDMLPVLGRRQVERLDYKKLNDETYGKASSESSDDEEWSGKSTSKGGKNNDSQTDSAESLQSSKKSSRQIRMKSKTDERTPQSTRQNLHLDDLHGSVHELYIDAMEPSSSSNGSNSASRKKHFGPIIIQKLQESYKLDPYPSRATKESLAQELGLTFRQVSKWFESTRHYSKVAASKEAKHPENHSTEKSNSLTNASMQVRESLENLTNGRKDIGSERTFKNLDKGIEEDSSFKEDTKSEERMIVNQVSNQSIATASRRKVGRPKGGSKADRNAGISLEGSSVKEDKKFESMFVNQANNQSMATTSRRKVGRPKGSKGGQNAGVSLELVDDARRKAILRELRKRKMSR